MKRHNNLFDKIVDKDNLLLAYKKAKKHKNWQQKVIRVEKDLDNLIEELRLSLINGTYKTAEYRTKNNLCTSILSRSHCSSRYNEYFRTYMG